jgi:signal transduction histidine kinase
VRVRLFPTGLRSRVTAIFGLGALFVATVLASSSFLVARHLLLEQRERTAIQDAQTDAAYVGARLGTSEHVVRPVLEAIDPPPDGALLLQRHGQWFATPLGTSTDTVPADLVAQVRAGRTSYVRTATDHAPVLVIGVPLAGVDTQLYRVVPLTELDDGLRTLSSILWVGAALAMVSGTLLGWWASRRSLYPLNLVATTAAEIAGGQLDARLPATTDPDLSTIVGSFNSMVDSLQDRLERDARFTADISHELRSPLTTLVASVELLGRHRAALPPRAIQAIDLVSGDLTRLQRLLDNLLHLTKADAGLDLTDQNPVSLRELLCHTLARTDRPDRLLHDETPVLPDGEDPTLVKGDKILLERAFANLVDNADHHGGGLTSMILQLDGDRVLVLVDDEGPGVPFEDRERIFDRFATVRAARGSSAGTGLGLALASTTLTAHGGTLWCTDRPGHRGARFVASLPRVDR